MKRLLYKPLIDQEICTGGSDCVMNCPVDLFELKDDKPQPKRLWECLNCEICMEFCQKSAIHIEEVYANEFAPFDEKLAFAAM